MKRPVLEKVIVVALFISVVAAFSLAERDTQKLFHKYNTRGTVELSIPKPEVTAKLAPAATPAAKFSED